MDELSNWSLLLRSIGSLALVLALIFALAWIFRRYVKPQAWKWGAGGIRVQQQLPLGPRKKILVVECEGRRFLVGVGGDQITAIGDLPTQAPEAESSTYA